MAVRTFKVSADRKERIRVTLRAEVLTQPGTLTRGELEAFKATLADRLMFALSDVPHLHVHISQMKVSR